MTLAAVDLDKKQAHAIKALMPLALCVIAGLMLSACTNREVILKGEREAILAQPQQLVAEDNAQAEGAGLSQMIRNINAGHPGLNAGHAGGHVEENYPLQNSGQLLSQGLKKILSACLNRYLEMEIYICLQARQT